MNIDEGWKFHRGHATNRENDFNYAITRLFAKTAENKETCIPMTFDDSNWELVNLPHDWAVELPFTYSKNNDVKGRGYKPIGGLYPENSVGWYRKAFKFEDIKQIKDKRIRLTFDGIYRDSEVWINGYYLGRHSSGYIGVSYDISDFIKYDESDNLIVVRVDASQTEGWFYEGAGIYRHVWLEVFDKLHFSENGIYIHSDLSKNYSEAQVKIQTDIENNSNSIKQATISTRVLDHTNKLAWETNEENITILPYGKEKLIKSLTIEKPELWELDSPLRYTAVSIIKIDGKLIDKVETKFGIRETKFDNTSGFFLNGKNLKIKGVCAHQDHAGLGSALPDYLQYYRISLLKEMGANAYRTAHNPPTPELLDACDSLGMLVIDETRLLNSGSEYMKQLESLVLRDRNHPSVIMWSIGNEEDEIQKKEESARIALSMILKIKTLDSSRTVTYAANVGNFTEGVNKVIPVRGFNYNLYGIDEYRKSRPDQPIIGTEVGSTVTTRGIYTKDTLNCYLTDFDENFPSWASTAEKWWTMASERDWFMGGFVWTGFDYRGEPTPYAWPNINSHFGIMDMCGFPKNIYYYYQSWWTDKDVLHISPHWNWNGKEGQTIKVWVNSNASKVELFLNGKSLGQKKMAKNGHLNWDVKYIPGTLKAVGWKNGRKLVSTIETTGKATQIKLISTKNTMLADGKDVTIINVAAVDNKGREIPDINQQVRFTVIGEAKIIGVGNGDPSCHEPDKYTDNNYQRSYFNGKCQVILQSGKSDGLIVLKAESNGLKDGFINITQNKK